MVLFAFLFLFSMLNTQNIQLLCDISTWNINGNVDICPPFYPCCFSLKGNASLIQTTNELNAINNVTQSFEILYFNNQNIPTNDNRNNIKYTSTYQCNNITIAGDEWDIAIRNDNTITPSTTYYSGMRECNGTATNTFNIALTAQDNDTQVYFLNTYYCEDNCPEPTPSPTIYPMVYNNSENIYENMCNDITVDSSWINSGNPNGIETRLTLLCPTISDKDCCTVLYSPNIWISKTYDLELFSNIHVRYSISNEGFLKMNHQIMLVQLLVYLLVLLLLVK